MNNDELLNRLRELAKEDFDYFSNKKKDVRERWVAAEFISSIHVTFQEGELISPEQSSKVDVQFRDARFQIKEITDPNSRRGKLYKDAYLSLEHADSLEQVSLVGEVHDVPPLARMYDLVLEQAEELSRSRKYIKSKGNLDLLIYVTRTRAALIQEDEIKGSDFESMGWRSVSCVNSKQAVVLFSSQSGPSFMVDVLGRLIEKND